MNYPNWVTDPDFAIPAAYNVRAKKVLYVFAACEKLRLLHNAGWKWVRGAPLTQQEQDLLAATFPNRWPDDPPSEAEARDWLETWWEPRQREVQEVRAVIRTAVAQAELDWVNLDGLI